MPENLPDTGAVENLPAMRAAEAHLDRIPRFSTKKHTLQDLRGMLGLLGALPGTQKVIHIAGTNGKGSVSAMLDAILRGAGMSCALFTSPHLVRINERFVFDGKMCLDRDFLRAFSRVRAMEPEFQRKFGSIPTWFEYLMLIFFVLEAEHPHEWIVLETGLGGRLDATSAIEPPALKLTVITSISLDHMQYLGTTIPEIAGEKAGILRKGVPLVFDAANPEAVPVIRKKAAELGIPAMPVTAGEIQAFSSDGQKISFRARVCAKDTEIAVPFPAPYQAVNALLAVRAAEMLGIGRAAILRGIAETRWPGRMEEVLPGIFLDGGHNEDGVRAFARAAALVAGTRHAARKLLIFDAASDKVFGKMLEEIHDILAPDAVCLTKMHSARALPLEELRAAAEAVFGKDQILVIPEAEDAFLRMKEEKGERDLLFAAGSLYLVGELKAVLEKLGGQDGKEGRAH